MGLSDALEVGVRALSAVSPVTAGAGNGGPAKLTGAQLEVAVLDRRRPKRAFRRITGSALRRLLGDDPTPDVVDDAPPTSAHAPSVPEPGTPAGLGDPANPDTPGGAEIDPHDEDGGEG
jgi:proteasome alpha subunit